MIAFFFREEVIILMEGTAAQTERASPQINIHNMHAKNFGFSPDISKHCRNCKMFRGEGHFQSFMTGDNFSLRIFFLHLLSTKKGSFGCGVGSEVTLKERGGGGGYSN